MSKPLPGPFYNATTLVGAAIALISLTLILFLSAMEFFAEDHKLYMSLVAYLLMPALLVLGLVIAGIGAYRERKRRLLGKGDPFRLPIINLNEKKHRRAVLLVGYIVILIFGVSAFASYQAYEHTDSDEFCGTLCHSVMEPEYTAYNYSPHARVGCAHCHIGPGADWFVRSKLSGLYQVYATAFDKFPRPIPTPIEDLRPAQETCEVCHSPKHFFSEEMKVTNYFLSDDKNSPWHLKMLMKTGQGHAETGPTSGIHWHMNVSNEITYAPADRRRMTIPWVRVRTADGTERVYKDSATQLTDKDIEALPHRRMDCIDCHNRPTHIYRPPQQAINEVMDRGWIDPSLPSIKRIGVQALDAHYETKSAGLEGIRRAIEDFYRNNHPSLLAAQKAKIDQAVEQLQRIYARNYFPEMKHDWRQYPDHIGHMYSPGCFRCHDGKHVSSDGKVLSRDCNSCHVILGQQVESEELRTSLKGLEYQHPINIGDAWKVMDCTQCHAPRPPASASAGGGQG